MKNVANKKIIYLLLLGLLSCSETEQDLSPAVVGTKSPDEVKESQYGSNVYPTEGKPVIYQVFTRLFGNKNTTNKPWGTMEENGVGKFDDFTDEALSAIKEFGVSHIWYTGVPHHALINDYSQIGISEDDPDVVKGRAGSPYAVKDYYNVNPDLAVDPANRLNEFKALIDRTHRNGMKVIIDIVPNHIARNYQSISKPEGIIDFGENDDKSMQYARDNNFYYIVGESFKVPKSENGYRPLNGEKHRLSDNQFDEVPAKWTGNGSRKAQPNANDWYETIKINYGVKPDGSYDFPSLPAELAKQGFEAHFQFWQGKEVPDSWKKFREITSYWTAFGVDGFRYDMAEMVPLEFWSYLNSSIKTENPEATLVAEVYNPSLYRDYINLGKMDYLYDKVDFYDTLKSIMQETSPTSGLLPIIEKFSDIDANLLHFLENHDEQRIASSAFAGDANKGKPAMVVSSLIGKGPNLLYFAQALGEQGLGDAGFGDPTRTTIFDYWGVPSIQRWMNDGKFDGGQSTLEEMQLRAFYEKLLRFSATNSAFKGEYQDLHLYNLEHSKGYEESLFSFARWEKNHKVIVVSNFSSKNSYQLALEIPASLLEKWQLSANQYVLSDILAPISKSDASLIIDETTGKIEIDLKPLESKVFYFNQ